MPQFGERNKSGQIWVPLHILPTELRRVAYTRAPSVIRSGGELPAGLWLNPNQITPDITDKLRNRPQLTLPEGGSEFLDRISQRPALTSPSSGNVIDETIPNGQQEPVQPEEPLSGRQRIINELVRRHERRNGDEDDAEYGERIRPGFRSSIRELFGMDPSPGFGIGSYPNISTDWSILANRGPITPAEIAQAERNPIVAERLRRQNQERTERIQQRQREQAQARTRNPQTTETQPAPPVRRPPVGSPHERQLNVAQDSAKRMGALLGQIKRTGRRATPNELSQIRHLYEDADRDLTGGIHADYRDTFLREHGEQFNRIRREFNDQADLLDVLPLKEFGAPSTGFDRGTTGRGTTMQPSPVVGKEGKQEQTTTTTTKVEKKAKATKNPLKEPNEEGILRRQPESGVIPAINDLPEPTAQRDNGFTVRQLPLLTREQLNLQRQLQGMTSNALQAASQPINTIPYQKEQLVGSLVNILTKLQDGDYAGAQQELNTAGGAAHLTQIANEPNLTDIKAPDILTRPQKDQFDELFNNAGTTQEGGRVDMPEQRVSLVNVPDGEQRLIVDQMNRILTRASQGMERRPLSEQENNEFNQLYERASNVGNPTQYFTQNFRDILQGNNNRSQFQPAFNAHYRQTIPSGTPYSSVIPPESANFSQQQPNARNVPIPQGNAPRTGPQPNTFGSPTPGGVQGQRPAQNIFGRGQQILAQGQIGLGGAQQGAEGLKQLGTGAKKFGPAFQQLKQGNFINALDMALDAGQQVGQGLNRALGGGRQAIGAGQNTANLFQGRPTQNSPGQPGMPGGTPPQGNGGLGALNNGNYSHALPNSAQNEVNRFYNQTVPSLAERFTALGGGQRSSAFQGALGAAGSQLGLGLQALNEQNAPNQLAAQQQQYNQQNQDRLFNQNQQRYQTEQQQFEREYQRTHGNSLLPFAFQPATTQGIIPGQPNIIPAFAQTVGNLAGGFARAMI